MQKVLVTGAGAPGGPGIILALMNKYEVIAADANEAAAGAFLDCEFEHIPKASDAHFIDYVLELVRKKGIDLVVPLVTRELYELAKNKAKFAALKCQIMVNNAEVLDVINDKGKLLQAMVAANMPVPEFYICTSKTQVELAAQKLGFDTEVICVKPCIGNGSRGFRILDKQISESDRFWNQKPDSTYITWPNLLAVLGNNFEELLVMEYLPGPEYTVDCLASKGKVLLALPRKRLQMRAGISTAGIFENNLDILDQVHALVAHFGLDGPVGLQFKANKNGQYRLLEINPRLQGTTVASAGLGINFVEMAASHCLGQSIEIPKNIAWGKQFIRYYTELFF